MKVTSDLSSDGDRSRSNVSSDNDRYRPKNMSSDNDINDEICHQDDDISQLHWHEFMLENQGVVLGARNPNIFCETEEYKRLPHEKLKIGEMYLGSGRGLEALPMVEQISDENWAVLVRLMRGQALTEIQVKVVMNETRQEIEERAAYG